MPTYNGTGGNDNINGSSSGDTISGFGGNDTLSGQDGGDVIYGGDGNDYLYNGGLFDGYSDSLYGENGDDHLFISGGDSANGGSGFDTLYAYYMFSGGPLTLNFTSIWTGGTFSAAGGTISNMDSLYVVYGTQYNDTITSGSITGSNPAVYGYTGADTLTGGAGNDWLSGLSESGDDMTDADTLYGLSGDDRLTGGVNDYIDGGNGTDALDLDLRAATSGANADFTLLLAGYTGSIFGATLVSIEHINIVYGTAYADTFDTSADNYGTTLYGFAGNDTLIGNAGANFLSGGTGVDTMTGGAGDDTYYVDDYYDVINESAGGGTDTVYTSASYILAANAENLTVSSGTGAVNCRGNALNNIMTGNSGANDLRGQAGNDTLIGNDGADLLRGDGGRDVMTGGVGADSFFFAFSTDFSGTTNATADLITDFNHAQGDIIALMAIDAIAGGADDAFTFIGTAAFSNVAGQLRFENVGGNTTVYGDTNGDGAADFAIALTGTIALVSGDFTL